MFYLTKQHHRWIHKPNEIFRQHYHKCARIVQQLSLPIVYRQLYRLMKFLWFKMEKLLSVVDMNHCWREIVCIHHSIFYEFWFASEMNVKNLFYFFTKQKIIGIYANMWNQQLRNSDNNEQANSDNNAIDNDQSNHEIQNIGQAPGHHSH